MEESTVVNEAPQGATNETTQETSSPGVLGLRTDERTGRKVVETITSKPTETTQETAPQAETNQQQAEQPVEPQQSESQQTQQVPQQQVQQPVAPQVQYYNPAEMSLAMQLGQVDESRIPPEYQPQYMAMKQKNTPPPKSEAELRTEFLDTVNKMAKEQAMKDVGLTEDQLQMGEFSDDENLRQNIERYKTALEVNRAKIVSGYGEQIRMAQEQAKQNNAFKQDVAAWIDQQRQAEPNFDKIGFFMQEHYKTMPYEKAATIAPAIEKAMKGQLDPQSAEIVKAYYDDCRKEFYAKKNGTSTTPTPKAPSVEKKGSGIDVEKPIDYASQLRTASARDKTAIVSAWLNSMTNHR